MQRVNLSVAIVSMVDTKTCVNASSQNKNLTVNDLNPLISSFENSCQVSVISHLISIFFYLSFNLKNKYNWSKSIQGILHSSIFVGIILSQVYNSFYFSKRVTQLSKRLN
jgi:hypothetical protein